MKQRVETSKKIIFAVMLTYFIALAVGIVVVLTSPDQLGHFLAFVGSATGIALTGYSAKSGAENYARIRRGEGDDHDERRRGE